jgi:hypothetical protein
MAGDLEVVMRNEDRTMWTTEMDELLKQWLAEGVGSYSAVAGELNQRYGLSLTRSAVGGRAWRLGIKTKPPQPRPVVRRFRQAPEPKPETPDPVMSPVLVPEQEPEPQFTGSVSFMQLRRRHCRYPVGEMRYCGKERAGNASYCDEHAKLCNYPSRERVR